MTEHRRMKPARPGILYPVLVGLLFMFETFSVYILSDSYLSLVLGLFTSGAVAAGVYWYGAGSMYRGRVQVWDWMRERWTRRDEDEDAGASF